MSFRIDEALVAEQNRQARDWLEEDYAHLGRQLKRRGVEIERLTERATAFRVAVPSWGVGTGGTRFARFAGPGEPRNVFEKLDDCEAIQQLVRVTPGISLHIPWDEPESPAELKAYAAARGLYFDSMNSNTFQDQPGQTLSYKFGSLTHADPAVRRQAVEHNLHCIELGVKLGARSHTVWIGDGGNFPGQIHFRRALDRYLESLRAIYAALPDGLPDVHRAQALRAGLLLDRAQRLGHELPLHARARASARSRSWTSATTRPNVNIEMIVARLIQFGKLAGFHFNDSKYGDDDLDAGSIKPFQLFLIFNELVDAELEKAPGFDPAYMLDQSHNVTDPIESLMTSAVEVVRAYVQAHLVDRDGARRRRRSGTTRSWRCALKQAFTTDVAPILAMARQRAGGAIDPVAAYRASGYRRKKAEERPAVGSPGRRHRLSAPSRHLAFDLGAGSGRAVLGRVGEDGLELDGAPPLPLPAGGRRRAACAGPSRRSSAGVEAGLARAREAAARGRSRASASTRGASTTASSTRRAACSRTRSPIATTARTARSSACCARCRARRSSRAPGIQFLQFNTLFQLDAHARDGLPAGARRLLMIPDLVPPRALRLDARRVHERLDHAARSTCARGAWADDLFARPRAAARADARARRARRRRSASCGRQLQQELGLGPLRVVAPRDPRHRRAPWPGTPLEPGWAYISSGTWSLVGVERTAPLVSEAVARANFTNEGGAFGTIRFLKNVMGLWILESCRREWEAGAARTTSTRCSRAAAAHRAPAAASSSPTTRASSTRRA